MEDALDDTYCCPDCFADEAIKSFAVEHGQAGSSTVCAYCQSETSRAIHLSELTGPFEEIIHHLYCPSSALTQFVHLDWNDNEYLTTLLEEDFAIFSPGTNDGRLLNAILAYGDVYNPKEGSGYSYDDCIWHRWSDDWLHRSISDHWSCVRDEILKFGHSADFENGRPSGISLDAVSAYDLLIRALEDVIEETPKGTTIWRARLNRHTAPDQVGAPPPELAKSGRGNIKGQSVLYAARDSRTALYEVRPVPAHEVTLAEFQVTRDLRLCSLAGRDDEVSPFRSLSEYEAAQDRNALRWALGRDLGAPVKPQDEDREYLPTQYLSSVIRRLGFDGIVYPSAQMGQRPNEQGANILLFDPSSAVLVGEPEHVVVRRIEYEYGRMQVGTG